MAEAARRKVEVDANRALLKRVLDAIIFLSHQGIPLRGHRESAFTDDSVNLGNFLEISCRLRCHYAKAPM